MLKRLFNHLFRMASPSGTRGGAEGSADAVAYLRQAFEARKLGDLAAAEALLREAISKDPSAASSHAFLGQLLREAGRQTEAAGAYKRALEIEPQQPEVRFTYAALLKDLGDGEGSKQEYELLVAQRPNWVPALVNYGALALEQADWEKALALLRQAVLLAPDMPEARVNLARALTETGGLDEAVRHCEAALEIAPQYVPALENLAAIHHRLGDADRARASLRARVAAAPSSGASIAAALTLPSILDSREEIVRVRAQLADDLKRLAGRNLVVRDPARDVGVTTFYLAYQGCDDRRLHEQVAALHLQACPQLSYVAPHCGMPRPRDDRIRIGVLSRYLYNHSIGNVTEGLIAELDRERFCVYAFAFQPPSDRTSREIAHQVDEWVTLPSDLKQAREAVARHELDVLFYPDVGMDPLTYFLTFARLARLQCTTWGHPVTTGVPAMDYFLSTDYFEPSDGASHYSERLVCLRDVAFPGYYRRPELPAAVPRESVGFDRGRRVYFCPQALFKFHPDFDPILGEILRRDPGGEIVIAAAGERDSHRLPRLQARLRRTVGDVFERIVFLPQTPSREGYLQRLRACDVSLDTIHYCGGNTSLEAISLGTPIVTLPSALHRGRHTYGFFRKMGFTETVAATTHEYVDLAVRIATDNDYRQYVKTKQSEHADALYEDRHAVEQIEQFFVSALDEK